MLEAYLSQAATEEVLSKPISMHLSIVLRRSFIGSMHSHITFPAPYYNILSKIFCLFWKWETRQGLAYMESVRAPVASSVRCVDVTPNCHSLCDCVCKQYRLPGLSCN